MPWKSIIKQCSWCGMSFAAKRPMVQTCSKRCSARLRQTISPNLGRPRKQYPPELVEAVRKLYCEQNQTQAEIASELGLTQKIVWKLMIRHDLPRRPQIKRNQSGPANSVWKGDLAKYAAMHLRVATIRGTPSVCEECGTTKASRYEWANLTGHFEDPQDYMRMCVTCHRRFDAARRKNR